jgi:hypothetical protein
LGRFGQSATASSPVSHRVPLMIVALSRAALGRAWSRRSVKYWRTSTAQPATSGVAMLVPPM